VIRLARLMRTEKIEGESLWADMQAPRGNTPQYYCPKLDLSREIDLIGGYNRKGEEGAETRFPRPP